MRQVRTPTGRAVIGAAVGLAMLGGCAQDGSDSGGQITGSLLGAGLGALAGSQIGSGSGRIAAALAGAAIGGLIGNRIGAALDEQSRQRHAAALQRAVLAPNAGAQTWQNPDQQSQGSVTPLRSFSQAGKQCTEVMQSVTAQGRTVTDTNSYCQEPDGSMTLLN
jgi:surface antigen